jgi:hypothetical protein
LSARVPRASRSARPRSRSKRPGSPVGEPFAERQRGLRLALADVDGKIQTFAADHYPELEAEIAAKAQAAAAKVDEALRGLVAAYHEREAVAQRMASLVHRATGRGTPYGLIPESRCVQVVAAATAVLDQGGEPAPVPVRDPRVVESGAPA